MPNVLVNDSISIGGIGVTSTSTFTVDAVFNNSPNETIPVYKTGTLSTRTSDTAGIISSTTHGIPDTATIAIVWAGGMRYDVDIDSVASGTISFSGGIGDNLPTVSTAVTVSRALQIDFPFNGTNIKALVFGGTQKTVSSILDNTATPVSVLMKETTANQKFRWYNGDGNTNPVTGDVLTAVNIYNISATASTYQIVTGVDNTLDQV